MASGSGGKVLQHLPFSSQIDVALWSNLASHKLHSMRLSSEPVPLWGCYSPAPRLARNRDPSAAAPTPVARFCVERTAFEEVFAAPEASSVPAPGTVTVVNTLEEFKNTDKKAFLDSAGSRILADIDSGAAVTDPSLLSRFALLVFSDLKAFTHTYWLAFPALCLPSAPTLAADPSPLASCISHQQVEQLRAGYSALVGGGCVGYFVVRLKGSVVDVVSLEVYDNEGDKGGECWFGFLDPSGMEGNPGWPLRNLVCLLQRRWSMTKASILCYRDTASDHQATRSVVLQISIAATPPPPPSPTVVGWEANARGKMGPRKVDLTPFLDPTRRAVESADLNLNLMKWRFLPELDTERLASMHCVLLGSGTLGCNVARCLLSWGCRKVSFLDYGKVSFSNPTRQWLFEFEDCTDPDNPTEGRPKAATAASRLSRIVPNVLSKGVHVPIPMPGHPVGEASEARVKSEVEELEALIDSADVVFLLTDSRESRWLPTLMCVAKAKPCINVALGFDTFLVMRHPVHEGGGGQGGGGCVGCYFCNDVVAPTDSSKNRTLDQQCTTTRPGLSAMASALSVELLVSMMHHPLGPRAPADLAGQVGDDTGSMLGLVPHQVRGFLANFSNVLIHGKPFEGCTACSSKVVDAYMRGGWEFLMRVFNEPGYLEEVSGLKALTEAADAAMADWDDEEEEDGDDF
mmetsp:Transcript_14832/g.37142  ORF Transcript_14832/g.37142 Transcript_14832/m.37142 type:complete len:688 (+) Transcript_14832:84-2147(+)